MVWILSLFSLSLLVMLTNGDSLICGHVGCGRYNGAHAFDHHLSTNHLFALELETQRVWDYAGDIYVHRLIQTKSDGKLVEFPPLASSGAYYRPSDRGGEDDGSNEKLDAMGMEYTYLLTSQLESQRVYYEERIDAAADKAAKSRIKQLSKPIHKSPNYKTSRRNNSPTSQINNGKRQFSSFISRKYKSERSNRSEMSEIK